MCTTHTYRTVLTAYSILSTATKITTCNMQSTAYYYIHRDCNIKLYTYTSAGVVYTIIISFAFYYYTLCFLLLYALLPIIIRFAFYYYRLCFLLLYALLSIIIRFSFYYYMLCFLLLYALLSIIIRFAFHYYTLCFLLLYALLSIIIRFAFCLMQLACDVYSSFTSLLE